MAVNTIGPNTYASGMQQKQQNMNNMFAALKSGDLATAQKAYAASGMPPMAANNTSPLGRLYQALRQDDLAGAQKAAAALAQTSRDTQQSNVLALFGRGTNINTWG